MNFNTRITATDTTISALVKMAEGNQGAITAMAQIVIEAPKIDPDDFMGGFGSILSLDSYGIYGSNIYVLWSDICDRDLVKTIGLLRACQLGFFSSDKLADACSKEDRSGKSTIPVDDLIAKVKERLPEFGK